jgi:HTH-type transcriptional regulator/antitoxin HipB
MAINRRDEYRVQVAQDLGTALRHFRTERNVTQAQAAEMEGIGQPYLSKLESGGIGSSVNHLLRLLRLLGCEIVVRKRDESG